MNEAVGWVDHCPSPGSLKGNCNCEMKYICRQNFAHFICMMLFKNILYIFNFSAFFFLHLLYTFPFTNDL